MAPKLRVVPSVHERETEPRLLAASEVPEGLIAGSEDDKGDGPPTQRAPYTTGDAA